MESKVLGYCTVVAILGIIAAATGFAGEATKVKASEVYIVYDTCVYPSSPAFEFGIVSAVFTIIIRIYLSISLVGARCCVADPDSTPISKLLFVFSWVASAIAVGLLFAAAALNDRQGGHVDSYSYITSCYVVKPGIFAVGAILALLSAMFGVGAKLTLAPPQQTATNSGVALPMGAMNMNVDREKNPTPVPFPPQQYPPQQYPPQQYLKAKINER